MLTSLVLSMTVAAPVPPTAAPMPAGPAPRILELKPNTDGKITVTVLRTENVPVGAGNAIAPPGGAGGAVPLPAIAPIKAVRSKVVELGEVKDLTITTADGKKLDVEAATKKLAGGGVVVVSTDGKPVSPTFLKLFKDDVLVLVSPELTGAAGSTLPRPGVRPLPAEIQVLPIQPGIQIQPGAVQIQIAPALPAVPVAPPAPPK